MTSAALVARSLHPSVPAARKLSSGIGNTFLSPLYYIDADVVGRPLIGGGALAVLALYAYSTGGGPKKGDMDKVAKKGEEGLRKAEGSARSAMGEMSGKKEGMGGFRSE